MKQWMFRKNGANLKMVADRYHISEIMAEVLVKRGLTDWEKMDYYLYPNVDKMHDGGKMKDMQRTVGILREKIEKQKKIEIIGDYDVDGIMSTTILYLGLKSLGAQVFWRIPHRVRDGYGIRAYMAEEAFARGVDTIITCDNGISAADAVDCAKQHGMTVLITDHHEVPTNAAGEEQIPQADAVVDPKQTKCSYPWKELCGAGVAYKLIEQLQKSLQCTDQKLLDQLLSFAAVATVCDVVPLVDENRIIVKRGLEILQHSENKGMKALIDQMAFQREIQAGDLGFRIGPCLNAAGRLEDAAQGVALLLEEDEKKAVQAAAELMSLNEKRKDLTAQAVEEAERCIEENDYLKQPVLLIVLEHCHESVAGIVAGRIREKYYRPTMILTHSGEKLKGSGRSIPGYHMQQELNRRAGLLIEYGGHAMAAGFSVQPQMADRLRESLNADSGLTAQDLIEKVTFDREVPLEQISHTLIREMELLQPVGEKNPGALFAIRGVTLHSVRLCGKENQIGQIQASQGNRRYNLVDFAVEQHVKPAVCARYSSRAWEELLQGRAHFTVDILYIPQVNARYGDIQIKIEDCR